VEDLEGVRDVRYLIVEETDQSTLTYQTFSPTSLGYLSINRNNGKVFLNCINFQGLKLTQYYGSLLLSTDIDKFKIPMSELK